MRQNREEAMSCLSQPAATTIDRAHPRFPTWWHLLFEEVPKAMLHVLYGKEGKEVFNRMMKGTLRLSAPQQRRATAARDTLGQTRMIFHIIRTSTSPDTDLSHRLYLVTND